MGGSVKKIFKGFHLIDLLIIFMIVFCSFSIGFIMGMVIPIFPTLVDKYFNGTSMGNVSYDMTETNLTTPNFNYEKLSLLFVCKNIGQVIVSPIAGYLCGIIKSIYVLLLGIGIQIITILLYGLSHHYHILLIGCISESISNSIIYCSLLAYMPSRYPDHKRLGIVYGICILSVSVGSAIGPAYGGWLYEYHGQLLTFLLTIIMIIVEIILIICIIKFDKKTMDKASPISKDNISITSIDLNEQKDENKIQGDEISSKEINMELLQIDTEDESGETKSVEKTKCESGKVILKFFLDPYFMIGVFGYVVIYLSLFLYFSSLPQFMRIKYGATESQQGMIWLLNLLGYFVGFFIGNILNSKYKTFRHIILIVIIYIEAVGVICISFMPTWWSIAFPLCLIVTLQSASDIILGPLIASIVRKKHNSKFGIMSGMVIMIYSATGTIGSVLGPILLQRIGFLNLNIITFVIMILYGPLYYFHKRFVTLN